MVTSLRTYSVPPARMWKCKMYELDEVRDNETESEEVHTVAMERQTVTKAMNISN